jgi:transcriptional regulator with XRE-family HTH domain
MVRAPLTDDERERGRVLGRLVQDVRGTRSATEVAFRAGISLDTLRKIERGAIPTPAFFTVVALARVLGIDLTELSAISGQQSAEPRVSMEEAQLVAADS